MKKYICFTLIILTFLMGGCGLKNSMKDGFYTAEMSDYSNGWKEYLCIMVKNDTIVYAEFNAKDPSGFIKAWDNNYMNLMSSYSGTYPNEYTRYYVSELIAAQNSEDLDTLTGASTSGGNFKKLSYAVIEQAKCGNPDTVIVTSEQE